jgi:outer membrane receptor for ferrienterochelin and colicins
MRELIVITYLWGIGGVTLQPENILTKSRYFPDRIILNPVSTPDWYGFFKRRYNLTMKKFYSLLAILLLTAAAHAQSIRLQLFDKNNSEPIPFAYVHILSQTGGIINTVQTDENGIATILSDQYPFTVEVNALGFETARKILPTAPANTNITLYLVKKFSTLDEVVITGVNTPVKQKDALSVYKIITKEQIQAQGAVSLDEVMKNQLNVTVGNDNILGSNMSMQGMNADKVKILLDGIPVNGKENGSISLGQLLMSNVERIEVIQGPMSVAYGSDALAGVINIITRKEKKPFSINAGGQYESIGRYNFDLTASKRIGSRHQVTAGGGRNQFVGWGPVTTMRSYDDDTIYHKRGYQFKPNEQYMANAAYSYTAPSGFNLRFASDYMHEKVTAKGGLAAWDPYQGAYTFDDYLRTRRSMNRLSLNGKLGKTGTWQSQNGYMLYYRTRNNYVKNMVTLSEELNKATGSQDTSSFSDVYARGAYSNNHGRLEYTIGYDVNLQYAYSLKVNGKEKDIQDYAAYANVSYNLVKDKLKLQGGLRGAYNTVYNIPLLPSINLLYTPTENVQLRASYAEGYRAPTLKELYLSFIDMNHEIVGNANLKPENSRHIQLSGSYQAYEEKNDYLQFTLTGFYNNVFNLITLAPLRPEDPSSIEYTYANVSHQENVLGTLQADGQYSNLHYQVGYTFLHNIGDPGMSNSNFNASEANATLQYVWKKPGIGFNTFYKISGKRPYMRAQIDGSATFDGVQDMYHMMDLSIEKKFLERKLQVIVGVKNVFDFQRPTVRNSTAGGGGTHGTSSGTAAFLPRSIFTAIRFSIN